MRKDSIKIPCPICGFPEEDILWSQEDWRMVRCRGCGLLYQSLRLAEEELLRRYQREYKIKESASRAKPRWTAGENWTGIEDIPEKYLIDYRNTLARIEKFKENGSLLEIGFGSAFLLLIARQSGWRVKGVEVSEAAVIEAQEKFGLDAWCGKIEDSPYPEGSFDVVVARHTIEHVYELAPFLEKVWSILNDGGIFLLECPNIAGLEYRIKNLLGILHIRRPMWERMYLPEHLYYFAPKTLTRLMEKHGFKIAAWETYSHLKKHNRMSYRIANLRHLLKIGNKMRFFCEKVSV